MAANGKNNCESGQLYFGLLWFILLNNRRMFGYSSKTMLLQVRSLCAGYLFVIIIPLLIVLQIFYSVISS
jgi:hypothetical protein